MVGEISFRYSWTTGMKKKFRNLVLEKGQISGFAQIDIFLIFQFFWLFVHNFLRNHPNEKSWVYFEQTLKSDLFLWIRFLYFFFIHVVQEYLNEIAPNIYGPNKLNTSGKPLRIADLQPPASGQDKPVTL